MSIRYTLRHLNASDCTPDNIKLYELVATKDTDKILYRRGDGTIVDMTHAAAAYAEVLLEDIQTTYNSTKALIDQFNYNGNIILTNAQTSADAAKASEIKASEYSTVAEGGADKSQSWAISTGSPDGSDDTNSSTGKSKSSRSWALDSRASAVEAKTSETNAKTSETNAKASETNAATSASTATTKAREATTSATNATNSATSASTSATTATTKASAASASAAAAATSASAAKTSETKTASYEATAKEYADSVAYDIDGGTAATETYLILDGGGASA